MEWVKRFWTDHGDRMVFLGLALAIAVALFWLVPDMKGEAKTVIIGVMMIFYNKARGTQKGETNVEK